MKKKYYFSYILAQRDLANGKKTMNAYLWKVCGQEYDESQDYRRWGY